MCNCKPFDCALQMAARETGIGAVETFMHAGKLLALDLLVKILENKAHNWANVRQEVGPAHFDARFGISSFHMWSVCSPMFHCRPL